MTEYLVLKRMRIPVEVFRQGIREINEENKMMEERKWMR